MSGVINVITKTPTKEGGSATVGFGNMGSQTYKINYGTPRLSGVGNNFFGAQDPKHLFAQILVAMLEAMNIIQLVIRATH